MGMNIGGFLSKRAHLSPNKEALVYAAVIGYPDEKWGEAVKAVVVLKEGESMTAEELTEWSRGKIAGFKIPKNVEFTDQIPRTPTGKILKRVLRDQFNK
ncbi:MAG: hypothetical protein PF482_08535 [Desulfobacteraceae bacterium]|jgi:acyl-CoA synthetase (AMP-forming)/AMP-acid ligase II|nr:hypothetical protein [Desulfobacteraceae bacterium]